MENEKIFTLNRLSMEISSLAIQAMLYEVSCYPSPGLVSPISSGAHKDMNYFTFIDSTSALSKYLPLLVFEGYSDKSCRDIFNNIRLIGLEAEKDMFAKTNNVNTHKGMLFLIGTACAAVGKAVYEKRSFLYVQEIIKEMTEGIVEKELSNLNKGTLINNESNLSHGEKLYLKYKNEGVRGEIQKGIPTVFNFSLYFYKKNLDLNLNDRLVHTLVGIMQVCDDSTIIHRHSPVVLEEVREKAREIIKAGGMKTVCGRKKINDLNEEFVIRNISPGGSADLLGLTVFLHLVEQYMNNIR